MNSITQFLPADFPHLTFQFSTNWYWESIKIQVEANILDQFVFIFFREYFAQKVLLSLQQKYSFDFYCFVCGKQKTFFSEIGQKLWDKCWSWYSSRDLEKVIYRICTEIRKRPYGRQPEVAVKQFAAERIYWRSFTGTVVAGLFHASSH